MVRSHRLPGVYPPTLPTERNDDEQLAALAQEAQHNDRAFNRFAAAVRSRIVQWARAATGDRDEAEDVAQLVLLRLRGTLDDRRERGSFTSWLYRITRNITIDRQRVARRRRMLLDAARHDALLHPGLGTGQTIGAGSGHAPGEAGTPAALEPLVRAFLDELSPRQQTVFELIDLRGERAGVVASQLGIAPSTVRVLLAQARRRLRLRLLEAHPELLEDLTP